MHAGRAVARGDARAVDRDDCAVAGRPAVAVRSTPVVDSSDDLERQVRELGDAGQWDDATAAVLRGYGPELIGFLVVTAGNEADASDAFSQFSVDLWKGLRTFRWESSLRSWCYTVARNALRRLQRAPGRRRLQPLESAALSGLVAEVRTPTITQLRSETKDRVRALRQKLPATDQEILLLRVDRNLPWRDVARILADDDGALNDAELVRRAAALRKQFERIKQTLRTLARDAGEPAP